MCLESYGRRTGGITVIAAGLCTMGGCFAMTQDGMMVDTYWPSAMVEIPAISGGTLGIYEYAEVPKGVNLAECHVKSHQRTIDGVASFFFVFQDQKIAYNAYIAYSPGVQRNALQLQYRKTGENHTIVDSSPVDYPVELEYRADKNGSRIGSISTSLTEWNSEQPGERLRILDQRAGAKQFILAHGSWGYKWYLLPMSSALKTDAVFDFEAKTLVEI